MARVGRKYAALFELAALPGSETEPAPPDEWASRLLRLMASASWADPSFLEEISESSLIRVMCRVLPVLKANAASRASASCVQDLADLEEAMRKLRHELALAEKRLPSHGILGSGGSAFYTTWACVGHVCTLMLQALTYSAVMGHGSAVACTPRASPLPAGAAGGSTTPLPSQSPAPGVAASTQAAGMEAPGEQANGSPAPAAAVDSPSGPGTGTPGMGSVAKLAGAATTSPSAGIGGSSSGSCMPALATEASLLKLLGNKHVAAHAKDVMRVVPEQYRAALARVLLTQISTEMKTTHSGLTHILQILKGDPSATSPVPSALPKAWFTTAALLIAFSDVLKSNLHIAVTKSVSAAADATSTPGAGRAASPGLTLSPSPSPPPSASATATDGHDTVSDSWGAGSGANPPNGANRAEGGAPQGAGGIAEQASQAGMDGNGDVEMADAARDRASPAPSPAGPAPGVSGAAAASPTPASTPAATLPRDGEAAGRAASVADAAVDGRHAAPVLPDDPRVALSQLLGDVASALCEAVTGAHGVGRMALLLRGEAAAKFPTAASYMPAALSINELMAHLDALACVGTALGAEDRVRPSISSLLASQAMKELLGAGKVYVTTVIAAGALTRDLAIDAVIPQSLRQGYMAAVLTPLETGALLNERRAPQVLAYRNSITESSYYQVMDADSLPYGVNVRFEDEQEAEGMGVVREWLSQITADIFSPERGLFLRGAADRRVVHPAPHSRMQDDYLGYMRFAGRIMGLALRANVPLGLVLSTGLFNYLTGRRATLEDLQQIDPQVHSTCQNILSTSGAEALELFHVWHGPGGGSEEQEQELLPGGAALPVTDANKAVYVDLLAHHVVLTVVDEQCAAFMAGVQDTAHHLPDDARLRRAFLTPLLLEDLNRITAGESSLDPEDWAEHTDVAGFESTEEQESLNMFWQLVSEYRAEDRQRLLQFWTAMTHLPSGGFKALNQRLQVMKLGPSAAGQGAGLGGGEHPRGGPAAAAAANGHGPSADGAGPHSHRLDGDTLEVEEQEQSDGLDEPPGDAEAAGAQQQGGDPGIAGMAGEGQRARGPSAQAPEAGHAAPAAESDLANTEGQAGAAAATTPAPATGVGATGAHAPAAAQPVAPANEVELPYGEDDELGAGEDTMDYGEDEEGDEEEFQRQLEMALALSLQDMPSDRNDSAAGGGHESGEGNRGEGNRGEGAGGAGSGVPAGGDGGGQAAPAAAAAAEPVAPSDASEQGDAAGEQTPRADTSTASETMEARDVESPATDTDGGTEMRTDEGAITPPAEPAEGGDGPAMPAPTSSGARVHDADHDMGLVAGDEPPAARDAGAVDASRVAEDGSPGDEALTPAEASAGTPSPAGGDAPMDLIDTEADNTDNIPEAAAQAADGNPAGTDAITAAAGAVTGSTSAGAVTGLAAALAADRQDAMEEQQQPADPQTEHEQARQQQRPAGLEQQEQQAEGQPLEEQLGDAAPQEVQPQTADLMDHEEAESGVLSRSQGVAAAPQEACRALPLLPQSRTCFLQLNLPVYGSLEDMRRAFAIALDNMSFGLH